jgi:hypothetical protein
MTAITGGGQSLSPKLTPESLARLESSIWPKGFSRDAWMIVDAARDQRIFGLLLECFYSQHTCLFDGSLPPALKVAAPYLVQLDYDDRKTRRFITQAWNNSWGVVLRCDTRPETLKRHLQALLIARDESGNHLFFRYYDPRVLRVYLPTCTPDELRTVYGPINCFYIEDENPNSMFEFRLARDLVKKTWSL